MAKPRARGPSRGAGLAIDAQGATAFDPSENVKALSEASNVRQDDLRDLTKELYDAKIAALTETIRTIASHQRELDRAESERLNSIRQVDREEVTKTAAANQAAITTLATSTATLAETLRTQVAVTASAAESRQSASAAEMTKRLSALELSASASMGKSTVADPQLERLAGLVERLTAAQNASGGQRQGVTDSRQLITWILATAVAILGLYTFSQQQRPQPAPVYVSPPATSNTPPATVVR